MSRTTVLCAVAVGLALVGASALVGAQRPLPMTDPGRQTDVEAYILNRGADEAVPITIQGVSGSVPVALTQYPRQTWEYRQLLVAPTADPLAELNAAGAQGWEIIGIAPVDGGRIRVLFKRPQ